MSMKRFAVNLPWFVHKEGVFTDEVDAETEAEAIEIAYARLVADKADGYEGDIEAEEGGAEELEDYGDDEESIED